MIEINPTISLLNNTQAQASIGIGQQSPVPAETVCIFECSSNATNQGYLMAGSDMEFKSQSLRGSALSVSYFVNNAPVTLPFTLLRGQSLVMYMVRASNSVSGFADLTIGGIDRAFTLQAQTTTGEVKRIDPLYIYGQMAVVPNIGPLADDPFSLRYARTNTTWSQVNECAYTTPLISNAGFAEFIPMTQFSGYIGLWGDADGVPVNPAGSAATWLTATKWAVEFNAGTTIKVYNYGSLVHTHTILQNSVQYGIRITTAAAFGGTIGFGINRPNSQTGPDRTAWVQIYGSAGLSVGSSHRLSVLSLEQTTNLVIPSFRIFGNWRTGYS